MSNGSPQTCLENFTENMSDEEINGIHKCRQILVNHLCKSGISHSLSSDNGASKLSKLSINHLIELANDMCDEVERRELGREASLPTRPGLSAKRNNARIRMSDFPLEKLNNLIVDVVQEIDRRKICSDSQTIKEEDGRKRKNTVPVEPHIQVNESPIISKKIKGELNANQIQEVTSHPSTKAINTIFSAGLCSGIDSLDAIIEDLGSMIDKDTSEEVAQLKQKFEIEINNLKLMLLKYEDTVIPEKNREISKLMSRIEETELVNIRLRKELASLNEKLANQETVIHDQKMAYDNVKEALDNIQAQLSRRVVQSNEASRNTARIELISSNTFSDADACNAQILSAVNEIIDCVSNFNQKLFLKLLRDIATVSKSFVIIFDRILQVSKPLNIADFYEKGEKLKSDYISALSSVLVTGKDFSVRPEHCSDFKSNVEAFMNLNNSLFELKKQFEKELLTK